MTRQRNPLKNSILDRRQFLAATGSAATIGLLGAPGSVQAQGKYAGQKVVFASWGGAYQDAQKVSFCEGFAKRAGATVVQDGPVTYSKLRVMIESGDPTWDVVDVTIDFLYSAAKEKLFEKIDTSIVDVSHLEKKFVHEYGIGNIVWSYNIGYNTTIFPTCKHPQSWDDVFDVSRFPGRRLLRERVNPMLEIALLADGVKADNLYPLDVDRAFKKRDPIQKHAVFWTTNAQSQQLLTDGEASVGVMISRRSHPLRCRSEKGGMKLGIEWNENILRSRSTIS